MSHLVSDKWFRRTILIPELDVDYNVCGELGILTLWYFWWVFVLEEGVWFYHHSVHKLFFDVSIFVV